MSRVRGAILFGILVIVVVGVWYFFRPTAVSIGGTFIFQTPLGTLVSSPMATTIEPFVEERGAPVSFVSGGISPDQTSGVTARQEANRVQLIRISLEHSEVEQIIGEHTFDSPQVSQRISNLVWSADGTTIAYRFIPPLSPSLLSPSGEPVAPPNPSDGLVITAGAVLPDEYLPTIFVSKNGEVAEQLIYGTPIVFSPDGKSLLVYHDGEDALSLVSIDSKEQVSVSGITPSGTAPFSTQWSAAPGGSYLLAWTPSVSINLYSIEWDRASVVPFGVIPDPSGVRALFWDFVTGNQLVTFTDDKETSVLNWYRLASRVEHMGTYTHHFPDDATVVQWFSE